MTNEEFAEQFKRAMQRAKLSSRGLHEKSGVALSSIYKYRRGEEQPKAKVLTRLVAALEAPELVGIEEVDRRQLITEVAAGMLSLFERVARGESPREVTLPHGDSIPLPKLTATEWEQQLQLTGPVFDELAGGDWWALSQEDRQVLVERMVDYYLSNRDHKNQEASA